MTLTSNQDHIEINENKCYQANTSTGVTTSPDLNNNQDHIEMNNNKCYEANTGVTTSTSANLGNTIPNQDHIEMNDNKCYQVNTSVTTSHNLEQDLDSTTPAYYSYMTITTVKESIPS